MKFVVLSLAGIALAFAGCLSDAPASNADTDGLQGSSADAPSGASDGVVPRQEHFGETFLACVGTPAELRFTSVTSGNAAYIFDVENTSQMVIDVNWTSPAPVRLELHAQSPDGEVATVAQEAGSLTTSIQMTIPNPEEGEWVVGVSCVGAGVQVQWTADVRLE